jgi:hypothetical protein
MHCATKTFSLGNTCLHENIYCAYCGKIAKYISEWDEYEKSEVYYCDCSSAIAELKYKDEFDKLEQKRRMEVVIDEKTINKLIYKYKLKELKKQYEIK